MEPGIADFARYAATCGAGIPRYISRRISEHKADIMYRIGVYSLDAIFEGLQKKYEHDHPEVALRRRINPLGLNILT